MSLVFRRRNGPARPDPGPERSTSTPTPTRPRSTSAWACTSTSRASCRCCSACWRPRSRWPKPPKPRGYLPIDGIAAYDKACRSWCSAPTAPPCTTGRIATVQALGGTGGLKVGADFLKRLNPQCQGADQRPELGEPPRAVHAAPASRSRPTRTTTPPRRGIRFDAMLAALNARRAGHRRRAARLLPQPHRLRPRRRPVGAGGRRCCKARGLVPFLDMAYQGFGDGIAEDGAAVQLFLAAGHRLLRRDLVLEELLAVRRARRRAERGVRQQGRGRARAVAAEGA